MNPWITLDLSNVPFFKQAEDVFQKTLIPLDVLIQVLTVADTVLNVLVKVLSLLDKVDPTDAIVAVLEALIKSLSDGKVSVLLLKPTDRVQPSTYVIRTVVDAFDDASDVNRPQFGIGEVCCGFVMYASTPDFSQLEGIVEGFKSLIQSGFKDLTDYLESIRDFTYPDNFLHYTGVVTDLTEDDPKRAFLDSSQKKDSFFDNLSGRVVEFLTGKNATQQARITAYDWTTGRLDLSEDLKYPLVVGDYYSVFSDAMEAPPDWQSMGLSDALPVFGEVVGFLNQLVHTLRGPLSLSKMAAVVTNNLARKIAILDEIKNKMVILQQKLENFYKLSNINLLPIPPQNLGNVGFTASVMYSMNKPPETDSQYVVGAAVCFGEALYPTVSMLMGLA